MLPPKPKHRGALVSNDPHDSLPSVDPIKREVSTPAAPTNEPANIAGGYIAPPPPSDAEFAAHRAKYEPLPEPGQATANATPSNSVGFQPTPQTSTTMEKEAGSSLLANTNKYKSRSGSSLTGRDVSRVITSSDKGVGVDSPEIRRRVEEAFGIPGSTEELTDETKSILSESVAVSIGQPDAVIVIDGVEQAISGKDVKDAKGITNLVNRIASAEGTMSYLDISAQAGAVKGLTDKLIEWDAPELIDKLIGAMGDVKEQQAMWEEIAKRAAQQSNVSMVKSYGEQMGGQRRAVIANDVISTLLRSYRKRDDVSLKVQGNMLAEVCSLYDPLWYRDKYDTTSENLHYFLLANDGAIECLLRTNHRVSAQAVRVIEKNNIDTLILNMFPKLGMV